MAGDPGARYPPHSFYCLFVDVPPIPLVRLTLFDGFYNTIRTRTGLSRVFGWWDVGDAFDPNEPDQSWTDQFFATKPVWLRAVIKISLIAVSITLYLLPYFIE